MFACSFCSDTFNTQRGRNIHQTRVHPVSSRSTPNKALIPASPEQKPIEIVTRPLEQDERPSLFRYCPYCAKDLTYHFQAAQASAGDLPTCAICLRSFHNRHGLVTHMRIMHAGQPIPPDPDLDPEVTIVYCPYCANNIQTHLVADKLLKSL